MKGQGYPPARRITRRSAIGKVVTEGKRSRTADLDVRYLASPLGYLRVGLIVPRYGQTAVKRNLLKRQLRELVRCEVLNTDATFDVTIRCRRSAYLQTFKGLKHQVLSIRKVLEKERARGTGR